MFRRAEIMVDRLHQYVTTRDGQCAACCAGDQEEQGCDESCLFVQSSIQYCAASHVDENKPGYRQILKACDKDGVVAFVFREDDTSDGIVVRAVLFPYDAERLHKQRVETWKTAHEKDGEPAVLSDEYREVQDGRFHFGVSLICTKYEKMEQTSNDAQSKTSDAEPFPEA